MEIEIKFNEVFNAPMGSPRPRFRKTGRFVQTYMPTSYTKHKAYIQGQMPKLNLERALKNGHVWKDDNQITEITSSKRYGIEPKIIIRIEEI
ncbi:TPA: RusA family crossover junction endodeoxyribonuclease [Staphylococcus aureus]|nr:RusA family crossover junction endodeoxyribonuclease [Staphylococcus aureus]